MLAKITSALKHDANAKLYIACDNNYDYTKGSALSIRKPKYNKIALESDFFAASRIARARAMVHEMVHLYGYLLDMPKGTKFRIYTNWKPGIDEKDIRYVGSDERLATFPGRGGGSDLMLYSDALKAAADMIAENMIFAKNYAGMTARNLIVANEKIMDAIVIVKAGEGVPGWGWEQYLQHTDTFAGLIMEWERDDLPKQYMVKIMSAEMPL